MSESTEHIDAILPEEQLVSALEALLFVSDEPVPAARLASILGIAPAKVTELLEGLAGRLKEEGRGFQLLEVAGGWRFYTHPAHHEVIERYVLSWDTRKLSQAALEALAVIAYGQPVTRMAVNAIRGVNSDGVIASLIEKGLVREVGRESTPGAPILYGTTTSFLEKFGLRDTSDLPPIEQFAPDEETQSLIRERLSGLGGVASQPRQPEQASLDELEDDAEGEDLDDAQPTPLSVLVEALEDDEDEAERDDVIDKFFEDLMGDDDD